MLPSAIRVATTVAMATALIVAPAGVLGAEETDDPLTVYSGRSEALVGPVLEAEPAERGSDWWLWAFPAAAVVGVAVAVVTRSR